MSGEFTKSDEVRLRDHISSLKMIRSSIQGSLVEIEPIHNEPDLRKPSQKNVPAADLEQAVLQQELMSSREDAADLRAKVYLLEREKSSRDLMFSDRVAVEEVLRTHIEHLQEELGQVERGGVHSHLMDSSGREEQLKKRVETLLKTLENMSSSSEIRQKQSDELIDDLKRANR